MKRQILNQKTTVLFFTVLLFIVGIEGITNAGIEFKEGEATTREIVEGTKPNTYIGTSLKFSAVGVYGCIRCRLNGPDANAFTFRHFYRSIQLKTKSALDYETKNSYEVKVTVSGSGSSDTIAVTINVTDIEEVLVFTENSGDENLIHRSIPENTDAGTNIGKPVSAAYSDGSEVALTYSLSGKNADMFEIDSDTGQLKTKAPLDYETFEGKIPIYFVKVTASDGTESAETGVAITIEPVNEFAPVFLEVDVTTREVVENSSGGVNVGAPLLATDRDVGDTIRYRLSGDDMAAGIFEINSRTGQLVTKVALDPKIKSCHFVVVYASDGIHETGLVVAIEVLPAIVEVPDRSLAVMIRLTLGLDADADITLAAISELTRLDAGPKSRLIGLSEIEYLTGLEHAENLTILLLTSNSVRDLTPLQELTELTTLEIYGNKIVSLAPLKDLTNLTKLQLGYNWIHDITPLAGLTNLTELHLRSNNRIKDITALKGLTNLRILNLSENLITVIRPLKDLTNLRELYLRHNHRLSDVSPLSGLVNLETLRLKGCAITDFSPLAGLTADIDILE